MSDPYSPETISSPPGLTSPRSTSTGYSAFQEKWAHLVPPLNLITHEPMTVIAALRSQLVSNNNKQWMRVHPSPQHSGVYTFKATSRAALTHMDGCLEPFFSKETVDLPIRFTVVLNADLSDHARARAALTDGRAIDFFDECTKEQSKMIGTAFFTESGQWEDDPNVVRMYHSVHHPESSDTLTLPHDHFTSDWLPVGQIVGLIDVEEPHPDTGRIPQETFVGGVFCQVWDPCSVPSAAGTQYALTDANGNWLLNNDAGADVRSPE